MTVISPARRRVWPVPAGLILLSLVPVVAGAARLTELAGDPAVTPDNARFVAAPIPVVVHIIGASLFCVLGAFQFVPGPRNGRLAWHRLSGRLLVPCGLAAALSGLWMAVFYHPPGDGPLLTTFRLVFGTAMATSIVVGLVAVRRRQFGRHRAYMIRGYAIGLGAGTQVLTVLPWVVAFGQPGEFTRAMLMLAAWLINLAVAERVIR